jgi:apolipoprotein N-acyltransferase
MHPESRADAAPRSAAATARATLIPVLLRQLAGVVGSGLLLALYARGGAGWMLGCVVLVPWMLAVAGTRLRVAVVSALAMSVAYVLAALAWFAPAIDAYTGIGHAAALLVLGACAPLLQAQVLAWVLVHQLVFKRTGTWTAAVAAACAWVACEAIVPKLFADTLAHGLQPSLLLRQGADLGGTAGLTLLLVLVNHALAIAIRTWRAPSRAMAAAAVAVLMVTAMAGYGHWRLGSLAAHYATPSASLRIGMVQGAETNYEARRREVGAYTVVREVLDTHIALSQEAIRQHGVDALLWSETVYPTPYGHARSADGAEFDREIAAFTEQAGISLVFGTYDVDAAGEYNAAAFLLPGRGLVGYYRKTHPFPLTEHVPPWLDGPRLRLALPWAGTWRPGDGARVMPLAAADGRELQVVPIICLDAVHPMLAVDGARLGAQAIVALSNDDWFSQAPLGAELHLAVSAFRSIETRMPQLRVTTNGITAFIDPSGEVLARTAMGDRAVLAGAVPIVNPPATLFVRWGDWVGRAALAVLVVLAVGMFVAARVRRDAARPVATIDPASWHADVSLLGPVARHCAAALRLVAGLGLAWIAVRMLLWDGLQVNSVVQVQLFLATVIAPAVVAWGIARYGAARARIEPGLLVFAQRTQRIEIPIASIRAVTPWRWPLPGAGVHLALASGRRWDYGIAVDDAESFRETLIAAGAALAAAATRHNRALRLSRVRAATHHRILDHALLKFALYPLVPALPAFRLHQYIAFGGTFGEWQTFGFGAWASALGVWWVAWAIGLMLYAALLRGLLEATTLIVYAQAPDRAEAMRRVLAQLLRIAYYIAPPAWLGWRLLAT